MSYRWGRLQGDCMRELKSDSRKLEKAIFALATAVCQKCADGFLLKGSPTRRRRLTQEPKVASVQVRKAHLRALSALRRGSRGQRCLFEKLNWTHGLESNDAE
jgi:hypothetical protein